MRSQVLCDVYIQSIHGCNGAVTILTLGESGQDNAKSNRISLRKPNITRFEEKTLRTRKQSDSKRKGLQAIVA